MPWHIAHNIQGCSGYAVVKDDDGKIVGCHPTEADAKKQLGALYASEITNKFNCDGTTKEESIWNGAFTGKKDNNGSTN